MRQLPPLASVIAFEAAARHESFRLASAELNLTPSAISHQVRNLEAWFGRRLFTRTTRQLALTEDGRRLLENLTPALAAIEDACAELRPRPRRAQLAVHCSPSFATKWLGPRLASFMKAHPAVTIRLSSSAAPVDLAKEPGIDVHIAYGNAPSARGVVVQPLGEEVTAPLCSPKLLPKRRRVTVEDVLSLVLIESQLNPVGWSDWCRANGVRRPRAEGPSFDRGALAVAAAVDGIGVALETRRFAEAELAKGELVALGGPALKTIRRPLHFLCHRTSSEDEPGLATFSSWLMKELG